jgi:hypothetical protein
LTIVGRVLDALACWGSARAWQRFHAAMALLWVANIPVAVATDLKRSIAYLIFVSLMTAFSGEMAALHGVTVQRHQEDG